MRQSGKSQYFAFGSALQRVVRHDVAVARIGKSKAVDAVVKVAFSVDRNLSFVDSETAL